MKMLASGQAGVARGLGDRGDKKISGRGRGREGKEKPAAERKHFTFYSPPPPPVPLFALAPCVCAGYISNFKSRLAARR